MYTLYRKECWCTLLPENKVKNPSSRGNLEYIGRIVGVLYFCKHRVVSLIQRNSGLNRQKSLCTLLPEHYPSSTRNLEYIGRIFGVL
jgi:hypothetical protein